MLGAVYGASSLSVFLLAGVIGYVFSKGFRVVSLRFFTSVTSSFRGTVGIAGNLVNTLYIVCITLLIAVPVGIGAAVYLDEYAAPGRLVRLTAFAVETLAGIPSVIFGLFGMTFFGGTLGLGYSLLNGSLTLAIMILPLIVKNTQDALRAVPAGYREAALGMGAGKWYMIRTVLLPSAMPGIWTGVVLAVGRITVESAALIFTAGSARMLPGTAGGGWDMISRALGKTLESGGTLAVELYLQMLNGRYELAFGIACVLIFLLLGINILIKTVKARYGRMTCPKRKTVRCGPEAEAADWGKDEAGAEAV